MQLLYRLRVLLNFCMHKMLQKYSVYIIHHTMWTKFELFKCCYPLKLLHKQFYLMIMLLLLDDWKSIRKPLKWISWISFLQLTAAGAAVAANQMGKIIISHEKQLIAASLPVNWFIDFDNISAVQTMLYSLTVYDERVNKVFLWHFRNNFNESKFNEFSNFCWCQVSL